MLKKVCLAAAIAAIGSSAVAANTIVGQSFLAPGSFSDYVIGTITISELSSLSGALFAFDTLFANVPGLTVGLSEVTFVGGSIGSNTFSNENFYFGSLAADTYTIKASGTVTWGGPGTAPAALIGATYTVTPVPEPTAAAMLIAGFAVMGFIAMRRRRQD